MTVSIYQANSIIDDLIILHCAFENNFKLFHIIHYLCKVYKRVVLISLVILMRVLKILIALQMALRIYEKESKQGKYL